MAADRAGYLAAYEAWVRAGSEGLAPSPLAYGTTAADNTSTLCEIDAKVCRESGLSPWNFYGQRQREKAARKKAAAG